ncbi:DUF7144 family membrane protein [Nocardia wallacei]|uniref:DUF7144 family membrane protein n=1 Tax=Nocardia wallacei TaxID=480035 RepID=UPI00245908BF|nr:hypothetical protein [Nocardia wallacei]
MAVPGTARSGSSLSSWTIFSGVLLLIAGVMHLLTGIAAIAERAVFVVDEDEIFRISLTGWGWLHVVIAALLVIAGIGIVNGQTWGYLGGIVMAALSVLANFIFAPMYPFWALVIIAIDVLVIWALARQLSTDGD